MTNETKSRDGSVATGRGTAPAGQAVIRGSDAMPTIRWDDSSMRSSYANVANVASTREEVVLLFGMNQAWHAGQKEVKIQLTDRLILTPFAAKRLSIVLGNVLREYEARFGPLPVESRAGDARTT